MKFDFSLAKRRVGIYFNNGKHRFAVQVDAEHADNPEPQLVAAIDAAEEAFTRVYRLPRKGAAPK